MKSTRSAILASLALAIAAGWFVAGHYFYKFPIGLDGSAFLFGEALQGALKTLSPTLHGSVVGVIWLLLSLIAVGVASALMVRRGARARAGAAEDRKSTRLNSSHL